MITMNIPFIRYDNGSIKTIAILHVRLSRSLSEKQVVKALSSLITEWIDTTREGKKAWKDSNKTFNIGDFDLYEEDFNKWLLYRKLKAKGIVDYIVAVIEDGVSDSIPYDTILVTKTKAPKI